MSEKVSVNATVGSNVDAGGERADGRYPRGRGGTREGRMTVPVRSSADQSGRDLFLDAVRAVAVVRVVTWHAYGWAPITWVVAAVPAMFFVSGHLLARSFARRSPRVVVADRLRRLLVPFWFFGLVSWLVMAAARHLEHTPETALPWRSLVWWVVPLNDPRGSVWESGWLSQPLWYVRCLLWLLLLSPALYALARRAPRALMGGLVAVTLALELVYRHVTWHDARLPDLLWRAGDVTLYAVFLVLGFWHAGTAGIARRRAAFAALAAVPLAIAVAFAANPQDDVVNNSHMLHLVVGGGWLAAALALREPIARLAARPGVRVAVRGIGRRSLSIYLWHTAAVITTWHLLVRLAPLSRGVHSLLLGAGTAVGTIAIVTLVGPVEDLAARRTSRAPGGRLAPLRFATPALAVALLALVGGVVLPDTARDDRPLLAAPIGASVVSELLPKSSTRAAGTAPASPRIPSRAPTVRIADVDTVVASNPPAGTGANAPSGKDSGSDKLSVGVGEGTSDGGLQGVLNRWQDAYGSSGLVAAVSRPGAWDWVGAPYDASGEGTFDIESITKTVTASAVWMLAADGLIDIEAPIPVIGGLPELAGRGITVRQLLEHRSGIPDYHDLETPEDIGENPAVTVIRNALAAEPEFAPGGGQDYSSTNYLVLGVLIEARTGRPLDDVLWGRVLEPAGVGGLFSRAGASVYYPGGGAGGLVTDLHGMLAWGTALLRDHRPVGEAIWARMSQFNPSTALGAGAMGLCPCSGGFLWVGHTGGTTALFYDRRDNVLVAVRIANGIWGRFEDPLAELVESLRVAGMAA